MLAPAFLWWDLYLPEISSLCSGLGMGFIMEREALSILHGESSTKEGFNYLPSVQSSQAACSCWSWWTVQSRSSLLQWEGLQEWTVLSPHGRGVLAGGWDQFLVRPRTELFPRGEDSLCQTRSNRVKQTPIRNGREAQQAFLTFVPSLTSAWGDIVLRSMALCACPYYLS